MIIDCHGHYTTEPQKLHDFRKHQVAGIKDPAQKPLRAQLKISDDEIRESLEGAQLKLQRERGTDLTIFSPRASGMAHHIGDAGISLEWSQISNELIHRVCALYPKNFVGVCQLPQSPGVDPQHLHRRARALRHGIRLRRLQSQSRSVRRLLERPAADRQVAGIRSTRRWSSSTCRP